MIKSHGNPMSYSTTEVKLLNIIQAVNKKASVKLKAKSKPESHSGFLCALVKSVCVIVNISRITVTVTESHIRESVLALIFCSQGTTVT